MTQHDDPRSKILARRAAFVAAALAGIGAAGCDDSAKAQVCLDIASDASAPDGADAADQKDGDADPQPCLTPEQPDADAEPQVCLSYVEPDADAEPQVCLSPPLDDADPPDGDAEPQPCLSPPDPGT